MKKVTPELDLVAENRELKKRFDTIAAGYDALARGIKAHVQAFEREDAKRSKEYETFQHLKRLVGLL